MLEMNCNIPTLTLNCFKFSGVELSEEQSEEQQLMNRPDCYIVINELSEFYDMVR